MSALESQGEHLRLYREASPEQRVAMIREAYTMRARERLSAFIREFERRHGPGSYAEHRAAVCGREVPERLSVALGPSIGYGASRGGVWS